MKEEEVVITKYPRCWIFDINRRVYNRDENGKSSGGPIWREHWKEVEIIGETKISWITDYGKKIPKKGGHGICFSVSELDEKAWVHENRHKIASKITYLDSFEKLQKISEIIKFNQTEQ